LRRVIYMILALSNREAKEGFGDSVPERVSGRQP